ncbi:hypothetical protein BH10ACT1_BH10ACT1_35380 [soil metagenome]
MGKRIAAVGLAVAIAGGGLAVAAIDPLGIAGAQDAPTSTTVPAGAEGSHDGPLARALDDLVADGTLTEAQAAKVTSTVTAEAQEGRADRRAKRKERRTELVATVAAALGSTPDEVKAGLKAGTSIAAQAEAKGVERQVVDDAVTKDLTARIDAAQEAGTITSDRATEAKGKLDHAVDELLDADGSKLGSGEGHGSLRDRIQARRGN